MAKTATITLGEKEYTIRTFTLGELEQVAEIISGADGGKAGKMTFEILRLALKRAEPAVDNPGDIEATMDEVNAAGRTILELAGLKVDPPKGQETGEA